jgi:hypothetical protein
VCREGKRESQIVGRGELEREVEGRRRKRGRKGMESGRV